MISLELLDRIFYLRINTSLIITNSTFTSHPLNRPTDCHKINKKDSIYQIMHSIDQKERILS
jgi:hypothetical protein